MPLPFFLAITVQVICAILGFELLRRHVLPALSTLPSAGLLLDVWIPLALVLPFVIIAARADGTVRGAGWLAVGGPPVVGVAGVGAAAVLGGAVAPTRRCIVMWTAVGLLLLLLACAHDLTVWTGQCAFAGGAVVMWMNTPEHHEADDGPVPVRPFRALALALACAAGQGAAALLAPAAALPVSGVVMVTSAAMALAAAAALAGGAATVRVAGWTAALGVLFGLGTMSLCVIMPEALRILGGGDGSTVRLVAHGFGLLAPEATVLLLLAGLAAGLAALRGWQRVAGVLLIAAAAGLTAWRMAMVAS